MQLWIHWLTAVSMLRPACSRMRTFMWLITCLSGFSIRPDTFGVTSIVRAFALKEAFYDRLLDFFHSSALDISKLTSCWVCSVLNIFPGILTVNGRLLLVGDGLKVPKSGSKMPAVKRLHQSSESNTKPQYIMGHSCQAVALLVGALQSVFAVPLVSRIHEGVVFSNRDTKTLLDKMMLLVESLRLPHFYFIADAYYSARKVMASVLDNDNHLVSQVRFNAVAYMPAIATSEHSKRGRPKKYGDKIKLKSLFDFSESMTLAQSPVYGEKDVTIKYRYSDLIIKRLGILVRFVAVIHPVRGRCILMCTDLSLPVLEVIRLYGLRFKIELSFKQALRTVGAYAYHFWMKGMSPINRSSGDQFMHRKPESYRKAVKRKMNAYHRFIQIGIIAQGLLQLLSVRFPELVWANFASWIRTIRPGIPPTEYVTSVALKNSFPHFLAGSSNKDTFAKFIADRIDYSKNKSLSRAA